MHLTEQVSVALPFPVDAHDEVYCGVQGEVTVLLRQAVEQNPSKECKTPCVHSATPASPLGPFYVLGIVEVQSGDSFLSKGSTQE